MSNKHLYEHLRGFIRVERRRPRRGKEPVLRWGLINTRTGQVIDSDGCCADIARAMDEVLPLVTAARYAHMHGFGRKDLR